jgi:hypothetical protein
MKRCKPFLTARTRNRSSSESAALEFAVAATRFPRLNDQAITRIVQSIKWRTRDANSG